MFKNKGMLLEELVNRTIKLINIHYDDKSNLGNILEKRNINIKIIKKNGYRVDGILQEKSYLDYFGSHSYRYFEIECKETKKEYVYKNIIRRNQLERVNFLLNKGFQCFLIFHFMSSDLIVMISAKDFLSIESKRLAMNVILERGEALNIVFPGVLNIFETIKKLTSRDVSF